MKKIVIEIEGVGMADSVEEAYRLARISMFNDYKIVFRKKEIEVVIEKGDRPADIMKKYQGKYNEMLQERMKKK